ncbi:tRNA (adenosine(37)-N6)-threonylcarbamoyltransferase complex dimerization subunit type 1 TsaB [Marimonas lutisalis]|uniref:tRNA (adenosine(37)-N6)-threonylcarbamoyltransferase complex dimerization subunit type 1 TsaB n=1 Tax=Marimonas lutisalis TaxID=2545756 RepID=UPI0010F70F50|nr:tRNA (adenosine(37)-N6)-threonylcarbamoyltransferase complex dimerization subunit type 1 TsaB [Marimonas lutisalis]
MPSDTCVLGFDTSAAHCAAALLCGEQIIASRAAEMGRGQAEHLFPMLEAVLADGGKSWSDLHAIGVGIGPGNFTGIRISVAAARGLALALGIPARGINSFDATQIDYDDPIVAIVPAPRDQFYARLAGKPGQLVGKAELAEYAQPVLPPPAPGLLARNIARLASQGHGIIPPAPLYIRPADAAPSREAPPVILANDT